MSNTEPRRKLISYKPYNIIEESYEDAHIAYYFILTTLLEQYHIKIKDGVQIKDDIKIKEGIQTELTLKSFRGSNLLSYLDKIYKSHFCDFEYENVFKKDTVEKIQRMFYNHPNLLDFCISPMTETFSGKEIIITKRFLEKYNKYIDRLEEEDRKTNDFFKKQNEGQSTEDSTNDAPVSENSDQFISIEYEYLCSIIFFNTDRIEIEKISDLSQPERFGSIQNPAFPEIFSFLYGCGFLPEKYSITEPELEQYIRFNTRIDKTLGFFSSIFSSIIPRSDSIFNPVTIAKRFYLDKLIPANISSNMDAGRLYYNLFFSSYICNKINNDFETTKKTKKLTSDDKYFFNYSKKINNYLKKNSINSLDYNNSEDAEILNMITLNMFSIFVSDFDYYRSEKDRWGGNKTKRSRRPGLRRSGLTRSGLRRSGLRRSGLTRTNNKRRRSIRWLK